MTGTVTAHITANSVVCNTPEDKHKAHCDELDSSGFGFNTAMEFISDVRQSRIDARARDGKPEPPPELMVREDACIMDEALTGVIAEREAMGEAIIVILWEMYKTSSWQFVNDSESFTSFLEYALNRFASFGEHEKTTGKRVYAIENVLHRAWQRELSGNPVVVNGEVFTADRIVRMPGLSFRLRVLTQVFAKEDLTPAQEQEAYETLLTVKDRDKVNAVKDRIMGRKVASRVFKWFEKPVNKKDEHGEPLFEVTLTGLTARDIARFEAILGKSGEKLTSKPKQS